MIAKYRPPMSIIAVTHDLRVARELNLVWGVLAIHSEDDQGSGLEEQATKAIKIVDNWGKLDKEKEKHAIVVCGSSVQPDAALFVGIHNLKVALGN